VVESGKKVVEKFGKWEVSVLFSGEYNHSVDAKGRVIMPAKFREILGDKFMITKGLDNCLLIYSTEEWENFYQKLSSLPMTNANARALVRMFLAGAVECEVDKQGRILLPAPLRTYAGIDKEATITGNGNKAEIWSTPAWESYIGSMNADVLATNMDALGMMI